MTLSSSSNRSGRRCCWLLVCVIQHKSSFAFTTAVNHHHKSLVVTTTALSPLTPSSLRRRSTTLGRRQHAAEIVPEQQQPSFIDKYPLVAKSLSMGITYGLADTAAQIFAAVSTGEVVPLANRIRRSVSLALVGCLAVGPLLAVWFDLIERWVPGRSIKAVAARTALDQIFQVPVMIAIIFSLSSLAEGHNLAYCLKKCQEKLLPTWRDCVSVWAPVQLINQGVVPLKYRVLFQAIISFFWDAYLSIVSHAVRV